MKVNVEDVSSVKKVLHIEVPAETVRKELDKAYRDVKKNAKIKGFRPGKAPRAVLERMFGKDVQADVASRLVQESFVEAIQETDLQIIGSPQVDPPEVNSDNPLTYDATVEIRPEIDDIDFTGASLKRNLYRVDEGEIDGQIEMLRRNLAKQEDIDEDRPLQEDDFALIDYEGFVDGQPFEETQRTENFTIKVGTAHISTEFDQSIVGMKAGEEKSFTISFGEDHFNKKLAGQEISFQVTLNAIRKEVLPEADDELAKQLGTYETLEDLKKAIRDNLEGSYKQRIEQELNEQAFEAMLSRTSFEVPDTMVEYELEGIISDAERSFTYHNMSMEQLGYTKESLGEKYRDTAVKQVQRHLILDKIVEQESLELSEEEVTDGMKEMAERFSQPVEQIQSFYKQDPQRLEFFKHTLLEKKAMKLIIDSSDIEDVEPSDEKESVDDSNS